MKRIACLLYGIFLFQQLVKAQVTPVVIQGSQVQKITSNIVSGQEYELQIMLPASYGKTAKKYPVVYLLDSQWDFPLVTALYGQQYYDGFVPEVIIVGVTWTGKNAKADSLRVRDYVPTNNRQLPQSGGADKFLSFLKQELIPYVESSFEADPNQRTLMGCSFGGLFTVYALFTEPGLFRNYIAATPAIGWDNESIYRFEQAYFENKAHPKARVYLCFGGVERGLPGYKTFISHLKARGYKHLQIKSQVLENIGHSGTKGEGYERGLQYAFERSSIQLNSAQLKNITGTYRNEKGNTVTIRQTGKKAVLDFGNNNQYDLFAASENELYATSEFLNVRFRKDEKGKVDGFELQQYGGNHSFKKIK